MCLPSFVLTSGAALQPKKRRLSRVLARVRAHGDILKAHLIAPTTLASVLITPLKRDAFINYSCEHIGEYSTKIPMFMGTMALYLHSTPLYAVSRVGTKANDKQVEIHPMAPSLRSWLPDESSP